MKLYLASLKKKVLLMYHKLFPERKLNVLRSFGQLNSENYAFCVTHKDKVGSLIFDSGTWTLNKAKIDKSNVITLRNYKNYAKMVGHYYERIFNFDSNFTDDGFEDNYYNQLILEEAGLKPVPVVHDVYGEEIDLYIDKEYDFVALGSSQITKVDTLSYVLEKFEGTGINIHLFGSAKFEFLTGFPIYSCDTAMWTHTGSYGYIHYWNPKKDGENKIDTIYMEEFIGHEHEKKITFSNYEFRKDLEEFLLKTLKITYQDLMGSDGDCYKSLVNTHFYAQLEDIVNQIHQQKGFNTMKFVQG